MAYADFEVLPAYVSDVSGSHVKVLIYDSATPTVPIVAGVSGINWTDSFEALYVEEAGDHAPKEIVEGRQTPNLSVSGFFSAAKNDDLPWQDGYIGREYTVMEVIGDDRPGAGSILNVWEGCKITDYRSSHGNRGLKTFDLSMLALRRIPGKEWATQTGA